MTACFLSKVCLVDEARLLQAGQGSTGHVRHAARGNKALRGVTEIAGIYESENLAPLLFKPCNVVTATSVCNACVHGCKYFTV